MIMDICQLQYHIELLNSRCYYLKYMIFISVFLKTSFRPSSKLRFVSLKCSKAKKVMNLLLKYTTLVQIGYNKYF